MSTLKSPEQFQTRIVKPGMSLFRLRFGILILACGFFVGGLASSCGHLESSETDMMYVSTATAPTRSMAEGLPEFSENATLDDYLRIAALNNAGLEAAFNRWKATLERSDQMTALPDPRFSYSYYIQDSDARLDPEDQEFALSQTFPWFGKRRLQGKAADEAAKASQQAFEKAKLSVFYRVKVAYHEYWYLSRAIAVTKEHLQLVTNLERVARTRYSAGLVANSAVIQAQVELGKLDDQLRTLEAQRAPIVAKLNAALSRPVHLSLPWPRDLPEFDASFTDEMAVQVFIENNPDLKRLDHLVDQEDASIRLARKSYYPDITVGLEYMDSGSGGNSGMASSGRDPVMAMVSVNIPLWYGKYRAEEREARFRRKSVEADRNNTQNSLQADLEFALYQFRDAQRKIDLYGNTLIPKAEQSLKVTQEGFETGKESFIALIDTQRLLLEFQLSHQRAQADRGLRLAEIEMLTTGKGLGARGEGER